MKKTKRLFSGILAVLLVLLCFSGCNSKQKETSLKLCDGVPDFKIHGNYTKGELDLPSEDVFEMLWAYDGDDDAEYRYVRGYRWPVSGDTLFEEAQRDANEYYPGQNPEVIISDYWNEPHDLEYAYYAGIKEEKNLMVQVWTFIEGDYVYQICVGYDLVTYTTDGIKYSIPKKLEEVKNDSAEKAFIDPDYKEGMAEFPNVEIHINSLESEYTKEKIEEKWGVENVEVKDHPLKTNDLSIEYPGYEVHCEYQEDGKTMVCDEYLVKFSDKYFGIEFLYDKDLEYVDYIKNCYRAFLYTIEEE